MRQNGPRPKKEAQHRINNYITAQTVRVVGENFEPKIVSLREALAIADQYELDLVEISPQANPPVCKVMDYQKYLYEQKKKAKEIKANSAKTTVKEIHMGPQTDDHDFNFKCNHAIKFLKDGYKVKLMVTFRGRSIIYKDQGELLLLRLARGERAQGGDHRAVLLLRGRVLPRHHRYGVGRTGLGAHAAADALLHVDDAVFRV